MFTDCREDDGVMQDAKGNYQFSIFYLSMTMDPGDLWSPRGGERGNVENLACLKYMGKKYRNARSVKKCKNKR